MSATEPRPSVVWVTNFAAPYRLPVWESLGRELDLEIVTISGQSTIEGRVRGDDWFRQVEGPTYSVLRPRLLTASIMGRDLHLMLSTKPLIISSRTAVVVGGWDSPVYWQVAYLARSAGVRTVGFYESTLSSRRFRRGPIDVARKRFFRSLDAVVVPGAAARDAILAMGVDEQKIFEGFNAVDVHAFRQGAPVHSEGSSGRRYLYLGQLVKRKNVSGLIEAFNLASVDGDSLSIVGDGHERAALEALVAALELGDRVSFSRAIDYGAVPRLMSEHEILVLPSTEEVWGLVVNEALASGMSVVVADTCGVAASVRHMRGVEVASTDPISIADAMSRSSNAWAGRIADPEILKKTPQAFARVFADAIAG